MSETKLRFTTLAVQLAERMAKDPTWRDATVRIGTSSDATADLTIPS